MLTHATGGRHSGSVAPLWRPGGNEIVVLEHVRPGPSIELTTSPNLGQPENFQPG